MSSKKLIVSFRIKYFPIDGINHQLRIPFKNDSLSFFQVGTTGAFEIASIRPVELAITNLLLSEIMVLACLSVITDPIVVDPVVCLLKASK